MRVAREELRRKELQVHALLTDGPLHDLWAIRLRGGGEGRTLRDFEALASFERLQQASRAISALFKLRWMLGRWFRWDEEQMEAPASSYVHRLPDDVRARSLYEPGSVTDATRPFRVVYAFETEALHEIINRTAHAFLHVSMEPAADGYTVYWAVYVKTVSWLTPLYMKLIDPFRWLLVYPAVIRMLEQAWASKYAGA